MSFTSRKKRPLERVIDHESDTNIIWVGVEGEQDVSREHKYFSIFQKRNRRYQFFIIGNIDGKSSPDQILSNLKNTKKKYEIRDDDEFWIAIDVDRWESSTLATVAKECIDCGFELVVSNPCFEVWLLYHYQEINDEYDKCEGVKGILSGHMDLDPKNHLGYSEMFKDKVNIAAERAKQDDIKPDDRWPNQTGSRVYKIIDSIKAQEE